MTLRHVCCVALMLVAAMACLGGPESGITPVDGARIQGQPSAALLRTRTIARLEILYFPKEMETLSRMTPERLERYCWFRLTVERFQWSALRTDLIATLTSSSFGLATDTPDCRWGCIFYDEKGARVLTMYFDGRGRLGLINGIPVTGTASLAELLERRCAPLWQGEVVYHPLAD